MPFAEEPTSLYTAAEVPQADKLDTIRRLAEAVGMSVVSREGLRKATSLSTRHLAYYRRAAAVLGLVLDDEKGKPMLGPAAAKVLAVPAGSNAERAAFLEAILAARALKPFRALFEGEEFPREKIADRIIAISGVSHSTAMRRAGTLIAWRNYVLPKLPVDVHGPVFDDITSDIENRIAAHNEYVKEAYLAWLRTVPPGRFEDIVTRLISKFPDLSNVKKVGGSGDGGVDIRARRNNKFGGHGVIIQVKRYSRNVQAQYVVNLIGAKTTEQCAEAVLITTSGFSQGAREKAGLVQGVSLINGMRLIELMVEHSVGLRLGKFGEIVRVISSGEPDGTVVSLAKASKTG